MKNHQCLATFSFPHQYFVLKLRFEEAAIRHYFQHETLIGILPFDGIRLMVHEQDFKKAKKIMDTLNDNSSHLRIV